MHLLTLCGSLRARSSNQALLRAYARLLPATATVTHYESLSLLPHFNPDLDRDPVPAEVQILRSLVAAADAVIISTPEYAHALPGSFKNALDWLVSDPAFAGKAVVILHVSRGSSWALDSLKEVLKTMSVKIVEPASALVWLGSNQSDETSLLVRNDIREVLQVSINHLMHQNP